MDKSNYYCFDKIHVHYMNDYIHVKDAIEGE